MNKKLWFALAFTFLYIVSMFLVSQVKACGNVIRLQAEHTGLYTVVIYYKWHNNHLPPLVEYYDLEAGQTTHLTISPDHDYVQIFYEDSFLRDVEVTDCEGEAQPPDPSMDNWQQGDSFFRVYSEDGWIDVYATHTGEGVLVLHTQEAACSADGLACYNGAGTVTLVDPEGKVYTVTIE